ncbi:MAG: hypothetical protein ABW298_13515 [Candidatus Binatia bacterium]
MRRAPGALVGREVDLDRTGDRPEVDLADELEKEQFPLIRPMKKITAPCPIINAS